MAGNISSSEGAFLGLLAIAILSLVFSLVSSFLARRRERRAKDALIESLREQIRQLNRHIDEAAAEPWPDMAGDLDRAFQAIEHLPTIFPRPIPTQPAEPYPGLQAAMAEVVDAAKQLPPAAERMIQLGDTPGAVPCRLYGHADISITNTLPDAAIEEQRNLDRAAVALQGPNSRFYAEPHAMTRGELERFISDSKAASAARNVQLTEDAFELAIAELPAAVRTPLQTLGVIPLRQYVQPAVNELLAKVGEAAKEKNIDSAVVGFGIDRMQFDTLSTGTEKRR